MIHCSLCFKTKDKPGDKNFFRVPKDERRRKEWSEVCRIDFKKRTAWVCRDHFLPSHIIKSGNRPTLTPNAIPSFESPFSENGELKEVKESSLSEKATNVDAPKTPKNKTVKNKKQKSKKKSSKDNKDVEPSQSQENLVVEIPIIKSVYCRGSTQTNTRVCGLVEVSEFADEFRFSCFYCPNVYPLENWKDFRNHLKIKHFEKEKAFEISEYVSKDHDYTPTNIPSSNPAEPAFETFDIDTKSLLPFLLDVEGSQNSNFESIVLNPIFCCPAEENNVDILNMIESGSQLITEDTQGHAHSPLESGTQNQNLYYTKNKNTVPINVDVSSSFADLNTSTISSPATSLVNTYASTKKAQKTFLPHCFKNAKNKSTKQKILNINKTRNNLKQSSKKTVLSRCLKRSNEDDIELGERKKYKSAPVKINPLKATEISFEYTPRAILDLLLDSMQKYPILWQFNDEPFNEDFYNAVEELCKIINIKWSLNIDNLKMRRSINRILRFYCYLFPNENVENIHQYTYYYDKCASFLPSSVNEIAYARCSHCYICYKNDFNLKRHLLKEQKHNLQWPFKCVQCKECFQEYDEYEFHKHLSHYIEVFRCESCNKKFVRRNIYNRHMVTHHSKVHNETGKYQCDLCDKICETINSLRYHKIIHRGRKYKCHLCPKSYFVNATLAIHLKSHRKEYDFMCEICGKEFLLQTALRVHMKKHTGEKVTCSICNLKLRKSSLSRHLRIVHVAKEGSVGAKLRGNYKRLLRPKPFRRRKEIEGSNYNCKICGLSFDKYRLLAEHNKEIHSDMPKMSCEICNAEFRQKVNLKRHYRRKHNLHVIQVYKLVDEHEDLNDVLLIETEDVDELDEENPSGSKQNMMKMPIIKSEFLADEISFEEEKIQSFRVEDDIIKATDGEEIKIDYMNDFFTDILREH